jgi:GT2 family glycosyltransferase
VTADQPDYVLLLNPDTEVARDALTHLIDFMARTPAAGACGPQLRYGGGDFQHGAFRFPGLFQIWLDLFPLEDVPGAHRLHNSALNGRYAPSLWQRDAPFPVDFVLGAAMLVRSATIQHIGGLDEGYFMYCEEMDWALRMHEAGWTVHVVPQAHVTHFEGQSSQQVRWPAFVQLWRSRLRFYGKHAERYPLWYLWLVRGLLRSGLAWRSQGVRRAFAQGRVSGDTAGAALAAYRTVQQL